MPARQKTKFLNVDLDIRATRGVKKILSALGDKIIILNSSETTASIELSDQPESAEVAIEMLIALIEALPSKVHSQWQQCEERTVNIGIQGGTQPHETSWLIGSSLMARMVAVGIDLVFTVYGSE